ncbi:plasmid transfer protein [Mucilaginibacter limnophilus]|uniref:Plasmid transfer protein n=1 Tax=Mucilaginibacter limnophilus TaxID=1932778 RepID=A0A437MQ03_9SPHI|nr:plasmid transfer protein [Mucilaginibacter limnophilus]RVT99721.1 plasmid transfer protein [Mucilaginibacter limnophilus]
MGRQYPVYKGLQRPLVFRGFKGKFIYYGVGCLLAGLVTGALVMALVNMYAGVVVLAAIIAGGLIAIAQRQKKGLSDKSRTSAVQVHRVNLTKRGKHVT